MKLPPFATVTHTVGRALLFAFGTFWEIPWALILGFVLLFARGARTPRIDARRPAVSCDVAPRLKPMIKSAKLWVGRAYSKPIDLQKREHGDERSPLVTVHERLRLSDPVRQD
ncbi:MAG: hypothetical protein M3071_18740 [Actinomycetota bacterium]|nr:hypothetical protein [Actinomycetota bacterium]